MSVDNFVRKNLFNNSYKPNKNLVSSRLYGRVSPDNNNDDVTLFLYNKEVIRIDNRGFLGEFFVSDSHEATLRHIYGGSGKTVMELVYNANMKNEILFIIENAGLILWLPPVVSEKQKNSILSKLESLKDKKKLYIYVGIANSDSNCDYMMIDDGVSISLDKAIDSVNSLNLREDNNKVFKH